MKKLVLVCRHIPTPSDAGAEQGLTMSFGHALVSELLIRHFQA